MKRRISQIGLICLIGLIIFLPFSSWLVSLTGLVAIAAIRDVLAVILLVLGLTALNKKTQPNQFIWPIILLLIWALLSYFWREASPVQWLKGVRFLFGPLVLLFALSLYNFDQKQKQLIFKAILIVAAIISLFCLWDLSNIAIPLTSKLSETGALESSHFVGSLMIRRVQAVLAGPNALGLYLLAIFSLLVAWPRRSHWLNIAAVITALLIVLTYSRSCLIGLSVIALIISYQKLNQTWGKLKSLTIIAAILILITLGAIFIYQKGIGRQFVTHDASSSLRYQQYSRIWSQKYSIGLGGRGMGGAGPSSLNRLDAGPNYWTENTYLDIFEELGLVGMLLCIWLIIALLRQSYINQADPWGRASFLSLFAFAVAGLFINFYTGQAGVWMVMVFVGLSQQKPSLNGKRHPQI